MSNAHHHRARERRWQNDEKRAARATVHGVVRLPVGVTGQMKVIFGDFDGVMVNRESWRIRSGLHAATAPAAVAALNRIIQETKAVIVVSSSWRGKHIAPMRRVLNAWGVKGKVVGVTPRLERFNGKIYTGVCRGDEIQKWIDEHGPLESFVILDEETNMKHLSSCLVKSEFEIGLLPERADRAIELLRG